MTRSDNLSGLIIGGDAIIDMLMISGEAKYGSSEGTNFFK